jgi:hypothetical protein
MTVLKNFFVVSVIITVLAAAALVQLVIALLPYVAAALIVALILLWHRCGTAAAPPPAVLARADPQPRYRVGAAAAAPGGWVMVPVWVAPKGPDPNVIDAEVITGRD